MQGFILEVSISPSGDELDGDHLAGDTAIGLVEWDDFDLDGGSVSIDDTVYAYSAIDDATGVMTLGTGLVADAQAGTPVYLDPPVQEKWAMVEVQENEDVVLALVPQQLWDRIPDGVRDPEEQEPINLIQQEGDWLVTNVVGEEPVVDGSFTDPATAPTNPDTQTAIDTLRTNVDTNTGQLVNIMGDDTTEGRLQNVEETATAARNLANTADGRVSMSDYSPAPEDVQYIATDKDGNPILDSNGNQVLLDRNPGSIWFVRTRARKNLCSNPSFEVNTTGWSTSQLTLARVGDANAPAGANVAELTDNTTAGNHFAAFDGGTPTGVPAAAGVPYTWSAYGELISGTGTGVFAQLEFFDAAGVSLGVFNGSTVTLVANDWSLVGASVRPSVTVTTSPANTASVVGRVINPNISDVWRIDGGLLEQSDILGSYFDGTTYDASWDGGTAGVGTSTSTMVGGKIVKVFELADGNWVQKFFMGDTLVDINAATITRGYMDGARIADRSVPIDKVSASPVTTSEALNAGDLVNIWSSNGSFRVQKASAADGTRADGFVLQSAALGAIAYVYSFGYNVYVPSTLTPGRAFLSATVRGGVQMSPPTASGNIVQRVGTVMGPGLLNFEPGHSVKLS